MTTLKLLISTLLYVGLCFAENDYCNDEKPQDVSKIDISALFAVDTQSEIYKWRKDFYFSLLDSDSTVFQAFGIISLIEILEIKDLNTELDTLLQNKQLSKNTMGLLISICEKSQYQPTCEDNNYFQRFKSIDANNIITHYHELKVASDNIDIEKVKKIIHKMSKSTFANSYFGVGIKHLKAPTTKFNDKYQIPINSDDIYGHASLQSMKKDFQLFKTFIKNKTETSINNELLTIMNNNTYSAGFRPLYTACRDSDLYDDCLQVSKILINNSDSYLTKSIGYMIQRIIYSANRDFEKFEQSIIDSTKYSESYECYLNFGNEKFLSYLLFHPTYLNTYFNNIKNEGEVKSAIKAYSALNNYLANEGIEDKIKKKNCGKILTLSNDEFYQIYAEDKKFKDRMADY